VTRATVQLGCAASSALRPVLAGPVRDATWLGVTPAALYLAVTGQPGVLAVLAADAVRLPCGVVLASTSAQFPLTALLLPRQPPGSSRCLVGGGTVRWTGPAGPVVLTVAREWAPCRPAAGAVDPDALAQARTQLRQADCDELDGRVLARLGAPVAERGVLAAPPPQEGRLRSSHARPPAGDATAAVMGLLGRGAGLTPSGDDLLAGFLIGAHVFGLEAADLRQAIGGHAATRTTALSAALLWHAARGECIGEVAALASALTGRGPAGAAAQRLLAVGHASGPALAQGLLLAAERAAADRAAA
jgi:hypothetical protein